MSRDVAQVTERVRAFYESYPFPDYEGFESPQDLMVNARRGVYPKMLDDELPLGVRVLDAGCGTGQLAIFLSLAHRAVIGADLSFGSLTEGRRFRERFGLTGVSFIQMDVFAPSFRAGRCPEGIPGAIVDGGAALDEANLGTGGIAADSHIARSCRSSASDVERPAQFSSTELRTNTNPIPGGPSTHLPDAAMSASNGVDRASIGSAPNELIASTIRLLP